MTRNIRKRVETENKIISNKNDQKYWEKTRDGIQDV